MPKKIKDVSQKIIDAALLIYNTEGFDKISIRKIAKLSGLSIGTVYNRFEDKEQLLAQVLAADIEQLNNIIMQSVFGKTPSEALYSLVYSFIDRMMIHTNNLMKLTQDLKSQCEYIQKIIRGAGNRVNEFMQEIIERVYAQEGLFLGEAHSKLLSEMALSMMQTAAGAGSVGIEERVDIVCGMIYGYADFYLNRIPVHLPATIEDEDLDSGILAVSL